MKKTKAFTLIETVVAMVMIAIIATAAFTFFRYAERIITDSELRLIASNYARQTMEEIYWSTEPASLSPDLSLLTDGSETANLISARNMQRPNPVIDDTTRSDYQIIRVTVSWN